MTAGLAAAILGFALQIAKYDGTAAVQSEGAVEMIRREEIKKRNMQE
ncbi:MAG: hypothetical protein K1W34_01280 [Lachnospiraceae bacterium]